MVKLWLDDLRDPNNPGENDKWKPFTLGFRDWTWVKTYDEAMDVINNHSVSHLSLDNDIADFYIDEYGEKREHEGSHIVIELCDMSFNGTDRWPTEYITVHSSNSVRRDYMKAMIERFSPYCFH